MVMMRLRTADGLDLGAFEGSYGSSAARSVASALEPHRQAGLMEQCSSTEGSTSANGALAKQRAAGNDSHGSKIGRSMQPDQAVDQQEGLRGKTVRLTDPDGFLVSNDVISDVFAALTP